MKSLKLLMFLSVFTLVLSCTSGCATMGPQQGPTTLLAAAKQQGITFNDVYVKTFDDVKAVLEDPASTQAQKDVAMQKALVLSHVWPILKTYKEMVDAGKVPLPEDTQAINNAINQLTRIATGGH